MLVLDGDGDGVWIAPVVQAHRSIALVDRKDSALFGLTAKANWAGLLASNDGLGYGTLNPPKKTSPSTASATQSGRSWQDIFIFHIDMMLYRDSKMWTPPMKYLTREELSTSTAMDSFPDIGRKAWPKAGDRRTVVPRTGATALIHPLNLHMQLCGEATSTAMLLDWLGVMATTGDGDVLDLLAWPMATATNAGPVGLRRDLVPSKPVDQRRLRLCPDSDTFVLDSEEARWAYLPAGQPLGKAASLLWSRPCYEPKTFGN